ncbi:hypothetical protein MMC10_003444 [Thelotrema lepadinum]|nr:hypothetical protein [Thelotrema lepadinum]
MERKEYMANDFLQLNYSLSAKVTQDTPAGFGFQFKKVYICIPWKSVLLEDDTEKEAWIPSADLGFYDSLYKGPANDESKTSWTSDTTVIEQDLSVTVEKTLALNKAIREINLVVPSKFKRSDFNWQTASDGPEGGIGDEEWPSVYSEEHGKLWTPRVLAVCQTKLEL